MESILTSIKKLIGISEEDASFDVDLIIHINTALFRLRQLAIGPASSFRISSDAETWADLLGDTADYEAAKDYVYYKVKLAFDAGSLSSAVIEVIKETIKELEFCLNVEAESEVV